MISKTEFHIASNREEAFGDSMQNNAFRCLYATGENLQGNFFPWHWHGAFEIDLVTGCDTRFDFEGGSLYIPAGNAVFINTQKIHAYTPANPVNYKTYALLFEPVLLAGQYNSDIFQRYILPVMNSAIFAVEISAADPALACVEEIIRLAKEEPQYYELRIRIKLEEFWCFLMDKLAQIYGDEKSPVWKKNLGHKEDSVRIKLMLNYIHAHYAESLTLGMIASAASISVRECSRCFLRSIRQSPMDYVNTYRIQMALDLLGSTDYSVTEISERCGFSSVSYFGKVFRQHMGTTPGEYRSRRFSH